MTLQNVIDEFVSRYDRNPHVLDLVGVTLNNCSVFAPPTDELNYLDGTVDIVVCRSSTEQLRRVAYGAVVTVGDTIETEWFDIETERIDENAFHDITAPSNGQNVLFIAPSLPEFDRESGSRRLYHLIELLLESGYSVTYATDNVANGKRYLDYLKHRNVEVHPVSNNFHRLMKSKHFHMAIIAFWEVALGMTKHIRTLSPHTMVIVDSIDLHFLRVARSMFTTDNQMNYDFAPLVAGELNAYIGADHVLTVSQKEAQWINDLCGNQSKAFAIHDLEALDASPVPFEKRKGVLFIGNFRHLPNIDALQYFMNDIVPHINPAILQEHPIYVVGNAPSQEVHDLVAQQEHVHLVGWVPSVQPYMEQMRITAAPLRIGAGTKRKLLQALMIGTPSVTTPIGAEGLGLQHEENVLVASDPVVYAKEIERLLTDANLWNHISHKGREHILNTHSYKAVAQQFQNVFQQIQG